MKIWYQSYSSAGFDPRWDYYGKVLERHAGRVARPDTRVDFHGVPKFAPTMTSYHYFQHLHATQPIENALKAQEQGYDAFVLGGMLDLAFYEIRDVLEIPVLFIAETSFHMSCLLAPSFSIVAVNEPVLKGMEELVKRYGLQRRYVPGVHLGPGGEEVLVKRFETEPEAVIDIFGAKARIVKDRGAAMVIPGFGTMGLFLADRGVREVEGVPVLDTTASLIKTAEMLVDMNKAGMLGSRGDFYPAPTRQEVRETRKFYGVKTPQV